MRNDEAIGSRLELGAGVVKRNGDVVLLGFHDRAQNRERARRSISSLGGTLNARLKFWQKKYFSNYQKGARSRDAGLLAKSYQSK